MRLFVPLTREEMEALVAIANEERRRPQDQGAALIARALRERGVLPPRPRRRRAVGAARVVTHDDRATSAT
jgi:hypothetical protein